jgi:hypothetical protein
MSTRRRFFIFGMSALLMSAFIYFTLNSREDKPLDKWMQWYPSNRVVAMITQIELADGKTIPKPIQIDSVIQPSLQCYKITSLEISRALPNAEVYFSHDLTQPRQKNKQYVVSTEINLETFYFLTEIRTSYTFIKNISKDKNFNETCLNN